MPRNDFSRLICTAPAVRSAFDSRGVVTVWWRVVLFLHGKPRHSRLPEAERLACLADGFRFYTALYMVLAGVLALAGTALIAIGIPYAGVACLLGAAFLAAVASLGQAGATAFRRGEEACGTVWLVTFLVGITGFLCTLCGGLSVACHLLALTSTAVNLTATATLLVFGVGSYLIEIVYLVAYNAPKGEGACCLS